MIFEFRVKVVSDAGDQLSVKGSHNRKLGKTSYTLFSTVRLFSVDYDRNHADVGNFHVHTWDASQQKPIAAKANAETEIGKDPLQLWKWFCEQTHIRHDGTLESLPRVQEELRSV